MKSCPVCKSTYEDWIDFCFNDGIPLVAVQTPAPAAAVAAPVEDEEAPDDRYSSFDAFDAPEPTMIRLAREAHSGTNPGVVVPPVVEPPAPVVEEVPIEVPVPPPVAPVARTFAPPPDPPPPAPALPRTVVPDSPPPAPVLPPTPPVAVVEELPPPPVAPPPRSALDEDEAAVSAVAKGAGAGLIIAGVLGVGFLIAVLAGGAWWFSTRGDATKPGTASVEQPKPVEAPPKPVEPTPTEITPPVEPPPPLPPEEVKPEEVKPPDAAVEPPKPEPPKPEVPKPEVKPVVPPTTATDPTSADAVWATPAAATKGVLIVTSDPVGAQVYVDGAARGSAPVRLEMPYGAHTVRATLSGYTAQTREINLNVEQMSVPLKLASEISSGSINLFGPTGGHVWLDNHDLGTLPVTVVVAEGVRNIRLTQSDGKTCSFAKEVRFTTPGKPVTVRLDGCP